MTFHFSRHRLARADDAQTGELNVVPYLDILMNLIIFMLLSMAGLATWGMVNINAPPTSSRAQPAAGFVLTVAIAKTGFFVSGAGTATIPRRADGTYGFDALTAKLQEVKAAFPQEEKLIIAADADISYDALVSTLDATRQTRDRKRLFPDVTLAQF